MLQQQTENHILKYNKDLKTKAYLFGYQYQQNPIQIVFYSGLCDLQSADIILLGISHKPLGFPRWHSGKEPTANAGNTRDAGSIPGSGRYPGVKNGNPLQYYCLENAMDRGAW